MIVSDVMTRAVVTVDADRTADDAAGLMLEFDVGSVVVTREGDPTGILTETDVLAAGHGTGKPLDTIPVAEAMSHPLITIAPDASIRSAIARMREESVKKLAVVSGIDLVGILTHTDVVDAHSLLLREAIHNEERRAAWEDPGTEEE